MVLKLLTCGTVLSAVGSAISAEMVDVRPCLNVFGGSASTSVTGRKSAVETVTCGVDLRSSDLSGQNFMSFSFQQSIMR